MVNYRNTQGVVRQYSNIQLFFFRTLFFLFIILGILMVLSILFRIARNTFNSGVSIYKVCRLSCPKISRFVHVHKPLTRNCFSRTSYTLSLDLINSSPVYYLTEPKRFLCCRQSTTLYRNVCAYINANTYK